MIGENYMHLHFQSGEDWVKVDTTSQLSRMLEMSVRPGQESEQMMHEGPPNVPRKVSQ